MSKEELRPINEIAKDINDHWKNVHFAARPYLNAMFSLTKVTDDYGADSAHSIVVYFLSNAQHFRGEKAKQLKAELRKHLE